MAHRKIIPSSWRRSAAAWLSVWLVGSVAWLGATGIGTASPLAPLAKDDRSAPVHVPLWGLGLDPSRVGSLAHLYVQLATGDAFSSEEASVLRRFAAGQAVSRLEADTVISRALYARYVAGMPLEPQQQALLQRYEAEMAGARQYGSPQQPWQRRAEEVRNEAEPNNLPAWATPSPSGLFAGTLAAPLPSTDVDVFAVPVPANSVLVLSLNGDPSGQQAKLGARVDLLDPAGAQIKATYRGGGPGGPTQVAVYTGLQAGRYFARVSSDPGATVPTGTGAYRLAADVMAKKSESDGGTSSRASIVNGDFETGDFTGWTAVTTCDVNGEWVVYSGTVLPISGNPFPAPPQGTFAAASDMTFVGTELLYQNVTLEPGQNHQLSFTHYYENLSEVFSSPATLDCTAAPNQQYRVDVMTSTSAPDSVAPGDVLATVFQTTPASPISLGYTPVMFDLTPWAGQTVRLRFAVVQSEFFFHVGVDDVRILSLQPGTGLSVSKTATPDPVAIGTQITYSITVTNNETTADTNVTLTDVLPANTTFVSATGPAGWTPATPPVGGTGTVTFTAASVPASSVANFTIVVAVGCEVPPGTVITNTATVAGTSPDPVPDNNTATATATTFNPAPVLTCPADITAPANTAEGCTLTGAAVEWEIDVTDNCPGTTVVCTPPSGTFFAIGTTTAVTCTATDANGATATCGFTVTTIAPTQTVCLQDDATGDTFTQVVDQQSAVGFWTYTVAATGQIFCGVAEYVGFSPGRSLVSRDLGSPSMEVSANLACGGGTVQISGAVGTSFTLRDYNTCDTTCATTPPPPPTD